MIPLESPVPEIGPPGSESGGRKRAHGNRTAARLRKHRMSHRSLPDTRLPSTPLGARAREPVCEDRMIPLESPVPEIGPPGRRAGGGNVLTGIGLRPGCDLSHRPYRIRPPLDSTSFKGGAGRSTALAATALHLAAAGERVAVLDADLDAPGVGTLLAGYDGAVASCGITDYLLEQRILGNPAGIDTEDYHHRYAPDGGRGAGEIVVCPAGRFDSRYMESSPESTTGSPRMAHRIPSLCSCSGSVRTSHQVGS